MQTTRAALAAFDTAQRKRAVADGRPRPALLSPSVIPGKATATDGSSATFFWLHGGKLSSARLGGARKNVTPQIIAEAILGPGQLAVPLDDTTARRMRRMMDSLPPWNSADSQDIKDLRTAAAALKFFLAQPVSGKVVTLTRALARKFYLPTGLDASDIDAWREAFGTGDSVQSLAGLLTRCMTSGVHAKRFQTGYSSPEATIASIEQSVVEKTCPWAFTASGKASLLSASEGIAEAWSGILRTDPVSRQRHVLDGTVVRLSGLHRQSDGVHATLSSPCKVDVGKVLAICDDDPSSDRVGYAKLASVTVDDDDVMTGVLHIAPPVGSRSSSRAGQFSIVDGAAAAHTTLLATVEPFLGGGGRVFAGRWGKKASTDEAAIERQVPLDVLLAGLPSDAPATAEKVAAS